MVAGAGPEGQLERAAKPILVDMLVAVGYEYSLRKKHL
jgi:hypothetical protein